MTYTIKTYYGGKAVRSFHHFNVQFSVFHKTSRELKLDTKQIYFKNFVFTVMFLYFQSRIIREKFLFDKQQNDS